MCREKDSEIKETEKYCMLYPVWESHNPHCPCKALRCSVFIKIQLTLSLTWSISNLSDLRTLSCFAEHTLGNPASGFILLIRVHSRFGNKIGLLVEFGVGPWAGSAFSAFWKSYITIRECVENWTQFSLQYCFFCSSPAQAHLAPLLTYVLIHIYTC